MGDSFSYLDVLLIQSVVNAYQKNWLVTSITLQAKREGYTTVLGEYYLRWLQLTVPERLVRVN